MEPSRVYDYLAIARGKLFEHIRPLDDVQYAMQFPIGLGSLGRTLTHIMISEWFYVQRLRERPVPPYQQWPIKDDNPPPFATLEQAWAEQAEQTRAAIAAVRDWHATIEYGAMSDDDGEHRPIIVTASPSDLLTQLALHEVHHRAQAMNMLRHLGVATGDLDFNALMYSRREAG